ncbi:ComEC/Rec2 family competence protein [Asticcacaulis taihuensis]|uniref:Competence protein ComEC n=1 Tax=Asticcacaulis taihuensis TaxID=260084 RepID=A0A1G4PMV2_9CAUL|nr:ComEC/Rec2 family competence protein [Asticcacaulis taihuensis]SCW33389.1 competence protein ComEC [Asticcacaulis taihuensis]
MNSAILYLKDRTEAVIALQTGRLFLWLPVAMGAGAAIYLNLPFEPGLWWVLLPAVICLIALAMARRYGANGHLVSVLILLTAFAFGAVVCKLRTEHVKAPVLSSEVSNYTLQAYVIDVVSPSEDQSRLLLAPIAMRGVRPENTPLRLRVSLRPGTLEAVGIRPGDAISTFAILNPPPPPNMPDGYDFARSAWYQGIGGVGLVPGVPRIISSPPHGWRLDLVMKLNRLRWAITGRLVETTAPDWQNGRAIGGFAAALVTGHENFIPQSLIQDMRDSGLAHILSISGVHMAIVGGFIFFALRGLMACVPWLALHVPVKKWAAGLSIICILLYLALSGSPAPAVRSAVVACVAFGAILLDRRALSLRALAIAAIVVICLTPEAVIQPGFQMSFSATAALLALAEGLKPPVGEISVPMWVKAIQSAFRGLWLSLLASVVATAATTPFAIAYFNRFSVYGLLSNLFEAPVTAFLVMPALALGTVFSATPLGYVALRVAGFGLWLIERIAALTSDLPQAVINWPSAPPYVLGIAFIGLLWVCLVRGKARWAGLLAATAILWWPRVVAPDVWIDPEGGNAAIRVGKSAYVVRSRVRQYGFEQWTQHYGLKAMDDTFRDENYACKGYACVPLPQNPVRIGFWFSNRPPKAERLIELCRASDLVVMRNPVGGWPIECGSVNHIGAGDFRTLGALELTRTERGWAIKAAQPLRGNRYWSRPSEAEGDSGF